TSIREILRPGRTSQLSPAETTSWFSAKPLPKAPRSAPGFLCYGIEGIPSARRIGVLIAQARRHAVGACARVVLQLILQVLRVARVVLPFRVWIRQRCVPRQRFNGERVRRVEIQILLEAIRIEKVIAHPPSGKRGKRLRIEIEFDSF